MESKKQTAVDWLYEEIKHIIPINYLDKFQKAKEMEKQQIIEAAKWMPEPFRRLEFLTELGELYYNETYRNG